MPLNVHTREADGFGSRAIVEVFDESVQSIEEPGESISVTVCEDGTVEIDTFDLDDEYTLIRMPKELAREFFTKALAAIG